MKCHCGPYGLSCAFACRAKAARTEAAKIILIDCRPWLAPRHQQNYAPTPAYMPAAMLRTAAAAFGSLAMLAATRRAFVAGEQLGGRAPSRLVLEIDVKRASGTVGLHNVDRSISKFLSIMLKVSAMRIPCHARQPARLRASGIRQGTAVRAGCGRWRSYLTPTDAADYRPAKRCAQ
jgi:hypothetical protein